MSDDNKEGAVEPVAWQHVANEWADMATNAIQHIRNIVDGITKPEVALANLNFCYSYCAEVQSRATPPAVMPAAPSDAEVTRLRAIIDADRQAVADALHGYKGAPQNSDDIKRLIERAALSQTMQPQAEPAAGEQAGAVTDAQLQALWDEACNDSPSNPGWSRHLRFGRSVARLAAPGAAIAARSEHYDEVKATLQGAHRIMETVSSLERRVGPVGSHARGYTHKITKALRHLDALAAAGEQAGAVSADDPAVRLGVLVMESISRDKLHHVGYLCLNDQWRCNKWPENAEFVPLAEWEENHAYTRTEKVYAEGGAS